MSAVPLTKLLAGLSELGVSLWVEGENLRFRAPQGALTQELRAALAAQKTALVELLRSTDTRNRAPAEFVIQPRLHSGDAPLSFSQERLWLIDQWEPGSAEYNVFDAIEIEGELRPGPLERAINEIIRRHEVMRTVFIAGNGFPLQRVLDSLSLKVRMTDLEILPEENRKPEFQRLVREEISRPFNLAEGPLLRVFLFRFSADRHVLLLNLHHIISDGWSTGILVLELTELYRSFCRGEPSPLPPLPIQYADFACWQRGWMKGERLEHEISFWRRHLEGLPETLQLPTDRPRPAVRSSHGATWSFALNSETVKAVRDFCRRQSVTLFMLLLSAWDLLLWKYSGQGDFAVGIPVANRTRPELERLTGFFVNTLVHRAVLSGGLSFRELLDHVRDANLAAQNHQDLPFEKLVEELQPRRATDHTPIFQVAFVLQNAPVPEIRAPGLTLRRLPLPGETAKFDLVLSFQESPDGLNGDLEYATSLFDASTIERMVAHFQTLLAEAVRCPERRTSELEMLTGSERRQLLLEWNNTDRLYRERGFIHQQIERQAALHPEDVAVVFGERELGRAELNRWANQLAWKLRSLGAGPGILVGICLERSPEMVIGLLGILKSGAAYVPLDPQYPGERLNYMMADAGAPLLLTQEHLRDKFPVHQEPMLCLDSEWREQIGNQPSGNLRVEVDESDLAYVIYTSGSTGRPKGVMNTHGGIRNQMLAMLETCPLTSADSVLQKTPFSFDVSLWEFFWTLMAGARLVLAEPGGHQDSRYLADLVRSRKITNIHFVPSMLRMFLEEPAASRCSSLKRVICGGEALPPELRESFFSVLDCELHNFYGPTEAAIAVTCWQCHKDDGLRFVPIGRPMANARIYVLDDSMLPVPVGVAGDLYIGGAGLARGYWRRPELTAGKFVPDPFSDRQGERLYQTGDKVRYRPEGVIEYLGRTDHQVKIRGLRIEPGEIEATLLRQDGVKEAVVMVREEKDGDKRLVAYLAPAAALTMERLRQALKDELPWYMVPSVFVLLERMPLLPSGKVDRMALPAPEQGRTGDEAAFLPPRDLLELQVAQIWEEILGVHPIGVREDFFDLGGHSLLAVQLVSRLRRQFGHDLPVTSLLHSGTVERLASRLRQHAHPEEPVLVGIKPNGALPPFFCVHPVGGNVLCYMAIARNLDADQPFYALQSPSGGEWDTVESMAFHYLARLREVQPQGPYRLGGWSMGGVIAFEMARQLRAGSEDVALLVLIDAVAGNSVFDRTNDYANMDDQVVMRNFITDLEGMSGKSLPVSMEELQRLTPAEAFNRVLECARELEILPSDFEGPELLRLFDIFRKNLKAFFSYRPDTYPGRVILITSSASRNEIGDAFFGWGDRAEGGVEVHEIPGDHYSIVTGSGAGALAAILQERLIHRSRDAFAGSQGEGK